MNAVSYVTIDNIEFTGRYWGIGEHYVADVFTGFSTYITITNTYHHGWTHASPLEGNDCYASPPTSVCAEKFAVYSMPGSQPNYNIMDSMIVDGTDTDGVSGWGSYCVYRVSNSTFKNLMNGIVGTNIVYGNDVGPINLTFDDYSHENGIEPFTSAIIYNNYIHDVAGGITVFTNPTGSDDFFFNNVLWNNVPTNLQIDDRYTPGTATIYIYNNTFVGSGIRFGTGTTHFDAAVLRNNHFITTNGGSSEPLTFSSEVLSLTESNFINMSTATATSQGYTSSNRYAPTSLTNSTVNAGTTVTCAGCGSAINNDILGVTRPQGSAWDIGAYEYSGADTTPPTLISSTIPAAGTSISLLHSEVVNFGAGGNAGWTVTMSGGASAMTYSSGSGSNTLVYSLARTICTGETGTIAYVQPGNGVEDGALNDLVTIVSAIVTDNSTVDCTPPTIVNVTSSHANGTFTVGEVIPITVTVSETCTSTGDVTVELETGTVDRTCTFTLTSASLGSCNYTVQAGDTTSDLTVKSISGTIKDVALNEMVNFTPATNLAANKQIVIDTTAPTISDASPSGAQTCTTDPVNKTLDVTTSENATCKWNLTNTTWALMAYTFSATGGTAHHTQSLSFACNASYNRYTRCQDSVGNESTMTTISFSMGAFSPRTDIGSMTISPGAPGGLTISPSGTGSITLAP